MMKYTGALQIGTCELCNFSCLLCLCSMPDGQPYYAPRNCLLRSIFKIAVKMLCIEYEEKMLLASVCCIVALLQLLNNLLMN